MHGIIISIDIVSKEPFSLPSCLVYGPEWYRKQKYREIPIPYRFQENVNSPL